MLKIEQKVELAPFTTIKIGLARAKYLTYITEKQQIPELYQFAKAKKLPVVVLGEGSNSIVQDQDLGAVVAINQIKGISQTENIFEVAAGEILDDFVQFSAQQDFSGVECLSGVPGTVGAAPIQNAGAYGQEIADTMTKLEAYDQQTEQFVILTKQQCDFSYRDSIFKNQAKNRYFITKVWFELNKNILKPPFYNSLQNYIEQNNLTDFRPSKLAQYIKTVRDSKIPDYKENPSAGSFFQNCLIDKKQFEQFIKKFPDAPYSEHNGMIKIPTGWLIDQAGLKGKQFYGFEINQKSALILINKNANSFADLEKVKAEIKKVIFEKFGLEIKQEPIIIS